MYDFAMRKYAEAFSGPALGSAITLWNRRMALSYWPFLNWSMPSLRSPTEPGVWAEACAEKQGEGKERNRQQRLSVM